MECSGGGSSAATPRHAPGPVRFPIVGHLVHQTLRRTLLAGLGALLAVTACSDSTAPRKTALAALADSLEQLAGNDPGFSERSLGLMMASLAIREGAPVSTLSVTDSEGTTRDYRAVISSTTISFTGGSEPPLVLRQLIAWQGSKAERVLDAMSSGDSIHTWSDTSITDSLSALDMGGVFFSDPHRDWIDSDGGGALQLVGSPAGACTPTQPTSESMHCANATFRVGLDVVLMALDSTMRGSGTLRHLTTRGTLPGIVVEGTCDAACQGGMPGGVPSRTAPLRLGTAALLRIQR